MLHEQSPIEHINNLKLYNNKIDHVISESLANKASGRSSFAWLLSVQIPNYDVNDAESKEPVSNDSSYLSIPFLPSVSPNLYAKPSDYQNITHAYTKLSQQKNITVAINFLNALKPNALHWQTEQQILPTELLENLAWHKRKALEDLIPESIEKVLEYEENFGQSYNDNVESNELADALLNQIKATA